MLDARNIGFTVNGSTLLRSVSVQVRPGSISVMIGPNGAGKSTLLRILAGELRPTSGEVCIDGQSLSELPAAELACRRAVVPQASVLSFPFTVLEVAMLGITVPGFEPSASAASLARDALDTVGMAALAERSYLHLSGGERQRVHIARALCQVSASPAGPAASKFLLLDEPTSNLDLAHQMLVLKAIRRHAGAGLGVLAVMHDLNLAAAVADDMVLLVRGEVAARGTPREVLRDGPLSAAYGCPIHTNRTPGANRPYVLPPISLEPL